MSNKKNMLYDILENRLVCEWKIGIDWYWYWYTNWYFKVDTLKSS